MDLIEWLKQGSKSRLRWLASFMVISCLVVGCSGSASEPAESGADPVVEEAHFAPDFDLVDINGNPVSLASTAGQVRLIDFWATWCPPCRDEVPMLNELEEAYRDQGFRILAISDESSEVISKFAEEYEIKYTNLIGTERVSDEYVVLGLPWAFLIDREGRVIDSFKGPKPRKILEGKIRKLLELPPLT